MGPHSTLAQMRGAARPQGGRGDGGLHRREAGGCATPPRGRSPAAAPHRYVPRALAACRLADCAVQQSPNGPSPGFLLSASPLHREGGGLLEAEPAGLLGGHAEADQLVQVLTGPRRLQQAAWCPAARLLGAQGATTHPPPRPPCRRSGAPRRKVATMMPVSVPKVLCRPPGQKQMEWVDLWEAYVSRATARPTARSSAPLPALPTS